jgi:SHAQKYF class myb-like DNA-binding protein
MPASFASGNVAPASFPINKINKGRWTEEEHKKFIQEYEKYGNNNYMQIAKVLSTRTPAQIKKHAECFFKQNLKTNSAQESLSPNGKAQVLVNDSAAHQKQRQFLSLENKVQIL